MGIGRNAAHALQIVQSYPFGRQDGPHTADDFGQFLAFMDFIAIFDEKLEPDLVVQQSKGPGKDIEAGDDAVLFAQEFRFTLAVFRQNGIGRHVFTGDVFLGPVKLKDQPAISWLRCSSHSRSLSISPKT